MGSTIGKIFKLTTFGESHGQCVGGIIEGCPSGIVLNIEAIEAELQRRKPSSFYETPRTEEDKPVFLSGIFEGKTTGHPIAFTIQNNNTQSADYDKLKDIFRPSHADYTYQQKYGIRDHRGGGRSSARETVVRVVAGAIAKQMLAKQNITIVGYVSQIGNIKADEYNLSLTQQEVEQAEYRFPLPHKQAEIGALLQQCKQKGDTVGGVVSCIIKNAPVGLGEPVFDKLHANLAKALLSIPAARAFELGEGFNAANLLGSQYIDLFNADFTTQTNHSGGVQGGISNGQPICFRVGFRPISSLGQAVEVVNTSGQTQTLPIGGRHDVCIVPRAVVVVESMAALVLLDHLLWHNAKQHIPN